MNRTRHIPPYAVIRAVFDWVCDDAIKAEKILRDLKYSSLNDYWYVERYGMHIGIERDGYIHS